MGQHEVNALDNATRMEIEWQCRNLCYEFAYCIDHRKYRQLAELFSIDGVFDRVGQVLQGRPAIVEALEKRSVELRTRHVCHNVYFHEVTADQAKAIIYNTTLVGRGDPEGQAVPYAMSQGAFLEFRDTYRKTSDGWRFAERSARTMLNPPDMPQHH
jgi:hypothetical protein